MRRGMGILWWVIVIVGLALLAGCASTKDLGVKTANVQAELLAMKTAAEKDRGGYKLIGLKDLKEKLDAKEDMLIIDATPYDASFKKQHIPTAVSFLFPLPDVSSIDPEMEKQYADLLGPDKNRVIVVYSGFVKCGRSHNGAKWAVKLGYRNVYRCLGGIRGWKEAGYPVAAVQ